MLNIAGLENVKRFFKNRAKADGTSLLSPYFLSVSDWCSPFIFSWVALQNRALAFCIACYLSPTGLIQIRKVTSDASIKILNLFIANSRNTNRFQWE